MLRMQGLPYSAIKQQVGVSKSTLSLWLRNFPLARDQIIALRAENPRRIERFRETMRHKREKQFAKVYQEMAKQIGTLTERELFVSGLFLYWAEGGKTDKYKSTLSNTDPGILIWYLKWLACIGVPRERIKIRLQLFADMDKEKEFRYWQKVLNIPRKQFVNPYFKKTLLTSVTYQSYGHGTCNIMVGGRDVSEKILAGLAVLKDSSLKL